MHDLATAKPEQPLPEPPAAPLALPPLPSGRSLRLRVEPGAEELEVRSPAGDVEVRITFTAAGPVVQVRGGRLELESTDAVALRCKRFEVAAAEGARIASAGPIEIAGEDEIRLRSTRHMHLNGETVRLNCDENLPADLARAQAKVDAALEAIAPAVKAIEGCCGHAHPESR